MQKIITACALIYKKDNNEYQCLVTKRSYNSSFLPGFYELPGGHIEPGETDQAGLIREIKEELNLEITVGDFFASFEYKNNDKTVVENIYLATPSSDENNIIIQEDEIDSYKWISESDIDSIVKNNKSPNDPEIKILKSFFSYLKNL